MATTAKTDEGLEARIARLEIAVGWACGRGGTAAGRPPEAAELMAEYERWLDGRLLRESFERAERERQRLVDAGVTPR